MKVGSYLRVFTVLFLLHLAARLLIDNAGGFHALAQVRTSYQLG